MKQQIINSSRGEITFSSEFNVSKQTTPKEIVGHFTQESIDITDMGNEWKHYSIRNIQIMDSYFIMTFFFNNDILQRISIIVSDNFFDEGSRYDWSEKSELQNREYFDDWLTKEIGENRHFEWGTIGAFHDSKGGFSSIILTYNQ